MWECPNCGRQYNDDEIQREYLAHPNHQCNDDCPGDIDPHPERE